MSRLTLLGFLGVLAISLATGCRFDSPQVDLDGGGSGDSGAFDGSECTGGFLPFAASNFDQCDIAAPQIALDVTPGSWEIDSDSGVLREAAGTTIVLDDHIDVSQDSAPDLRVLSFQSVVIAAGVSLRFVGSRAVAVVSAGDITIDGVISVAAFDSRSPGAGGNSTYCTSGIAKDGNPGGDGAGDVAGSGGGGGGFGSAGATGGPVSMFQPATAGGESEPGAALIPLRGGCRGGKGGNDDSSGVGGAGGAGGGALQLVAATRIAVSPSATVLARGGAGGGGNAPGAGGGGGGSGGAILLEAPELDIQGYLIASGGGGGQGADELADGANGNQAMAGDVTPPAGGTSAVQGATGGNGGASDSQLPGPGAASTGVTVPGQAFGGGGGGGGYGRIRLNGYQSTSKDDSRIRPPAVVN